MEDERNSGSETNSFFIQVRETKRKDLEIAFRGAGGCLDTAMAAVSSRFQSLCYTKLTGCWLKLHIYHIGINILSERNIPTFQGF